ncbi:MAG: Crp/Fnr family transcriptional regulator [Aquabacterium sp.]|uniref:Crp/Fnr family transcriptional regulator n=1 Tax=Aquabacterium sp. TaxID=1872578 RepID=UPI00120CEB44|nr:Crp/Fnr family transcriptional regulator [Aquabacterium sp.]TAK93887.1 MAG: Crp/Fnr family transcriptional regulator [Aquabacterium sp.]
MANLSAAQRELLLSDIWLSQVPSALADALMSQGMIKTLRDGETLFLRGEPVDGLYAVLDGGFHITGVTRDGREAMLSLIEPPMWFGEIALFDRLPRTHDAVAVGPTALLFVPLGTLDVILDAQPLWWRHFGKLMAFKVRMAFIALEDLSIVQPAERLARRLVWLTYCAVTGGEVGRCKLTIKQTQLALMVALSRQTVNQLLRALEERGVIRLSYGLIEVLDLVALVEAAALTPVERRMLVHAGFFPLQASEVFP